MIAEYMIKQWRTWMGQSGGRTVLAVSLNFEHWNTSSGSLFVWERVYIRTDTRFLWTPIIIARRRYPWRSVWNGTWPYPMPEAP